MSGLCSNSLKRPRYMKVRLCSGLGATSAAPRRYARSGPRWLGSQREVSVIGFGDIMGNLGKQMFKIQDFLDMEFPGRFARRFCRLRGTGTDICGPLQTAPGSILAPRPMKSRFCHLYNYTAGLLYLYIKFY